MKLSTLRRITLTAVVLLVIAGLIWNTGTGTLSSTGWRYIASVCPLGAVESFLASRAVFPYALILLVLVILVCILLGKFFCSWLCPIPPLRRLFSRKKRTAVDKTGHHTAVDKAGRQSAGGLPAEVVESAQSAESVEALKIEMQSTEALSAGALSTEEQTIKVQTKSGIKPLTDEERAILHNGSCKSNCGSCAEKRKKLDSRHIVLGGALLSTVLFGFPVFCLICPVGLVFATIIAFWHWIGFNELTFSLLLFPAILIVEVLILRKWCLKFCPLGAVFSLMSLPNRFFRPKVDNSKCLRMQGIECNLCVEYCEEKLDPHFSEGMHECAKCGHCMEHCPAKAITIPFLPPKKKKLSLIK